MTRQRLLDAVARQPGISIRELADALGVRRTAVVHHLRLLARPPQVRCVRAGRRVLVFPAAATPFEGLVGLMRLPTVKKVVETIQADPGISVRGLGRALGVTPRAIRYHLLRLEGLGLLERQWAAGRRVFRLDAKAPIAIQVGPGGPPRDVRPVGEGLMVAHVQAGVEAGRR